jgi:GNAT superfamily N-acetyltransferase
MEGIVIIQIDDMLNLDWKQLVKESKEEGFRFLERLVVEYENGTNKFNKTGESLYGVFNKEVELVAIGGLNIDPFSNEKCIGRLRRFYVSRGYRRNGLGKLLLHRIICDAQKHYQVLVLHTDTEQAGQFYISQGFLKGERYHKSTHYLDL